jgi:hypothetical protein
MGGFIINQYNRIFRPCHLPFTFGIPLPDVEAGFREVNRQAPVVIHLQTALLPAAIRFHENIAGYRKKSF